MVSRSRILCLWAASAALALSAGCSINALTQPETVESQVIPLTHGGAKEISPQDLVQKMGNPNDVQFFGDRLVYMGDKNGYRYVHLRDMYRSDTFLGEHDYKVREADWPMEHPMRLMRDAHKWQDVSWMNGDTLPGALEDWNLYASPSYPMGTPATQPTSYPATESDAPPPATLQTSPPGLPPLPPGELPPPTTTNTTGPSTQPSASQPGSKPRLTRSGRIRRALQETTSA